MGVYIYTLKSSSPINTPDGPVLRYTYLARIAGSGWDAKDRQDALLGRLMDRFPDVGPSLVIEDGENPAHREGRPVYFQAKPQVVWYDCDAPPGILVGYMRKVGRSWTISTVGEEITRSVEGLMLYAHHHQLNHDTTLISLHEVCRDHFNRTHKKGGYVVIKTDQDSKSNREIEHAGNLLNHTP
jgi:hypothetical protein